MYLNKKKIGLKKNENKAIIFSLISSLIIFAVSSCFNLITSYLNSSRQKNNIIKMITIEAERNLVAMEPFTAMGEKLYLYKENRCNYNLDINNEQIKFILQQSKDLRYDVYKAYLGSFMNLDSKDLQYFMMYYSNLIAFKRLTGETLEKIKTIDNFQLTDSIKKSLLIGYCYEVSDPGVIIDKYKKSTK